MYALGSAGGFNAKARFFLVFGAGLSGLGESYDQVR